MKQETKQRLDYKLDRVVIIIMIATVIGFAAIRISATLFGISALWSLLALVVGLSALIAAMLLKGALTGKRYMQGAKHRREKWFPFFFRKNESLADEAFKSWEGKN
ncbi:MAG: hypothetical protein F9K23_10920 [Bacteroidetes bacterium]|nr:MAG: hypothetical protein F9K23_10920 [Bacteroidota bacterium]